MKKIIDGRMFNTDTAKVLGSNSGGGYTNDFHYWEETLYLKKTGEYFLVGEGGGLSKYSVSCGNNSWGYGHRIMPLSESEAMAWAEENLDADEYEALFGEVAE